MVPVAVDLELFDGDVDDAPGQHIGQKLDGLYVRCNVIRDDWSYYEKFQQLCL